MKAILLILMNVILKFISRSFLQYDKMLELYIKKYQPMVWISQEVSYQTSQEVRAIWQWNLSVNRVWHDKYFSWKAIIEVWWKNYSQTLL